MNEKDKKLSKLFNTKKKLQNEINLLRQRSTMNSKEKLGASENPFTSETSNLGDREDKLDALENPENPFTGSNFTWGEREQNFSSANSFNKQPNKMIHHAPEDPIDIQIFMDSNSQFINEKRVSPDGRLKTKISTCGSISYLGKLVNSVPENLKALLHTKCQ